MVHPDFGGFEEKMTLANVDAYNRRCFWMAGNGTAR